MYLDASSLFKCLVHCHLRVTVSSPKRPARTAWVHICNVCFARWVFAHKAFFALLQSFQMCPQQGFNSSTQPKFAFSQLPIGNLNCSASSFYYNCAAYFSLTTFELSVSQNISVFHETLMLSSFHLLVYHLRQLCPCLGRLARLKCWSC